MDIQRMKTLKEQLMACIETQMAKGLDNVDACELGEAVDMVKDLSEALYYCEITKAMEEPQIKYLTRERLDKPEYDYTRYHDEREHRPKMHHDKASLEEYMSDLSMELTEIIRDATPEEKQLLQQKISMLATKIK